MFQAAPINDYKISLIISKSDIFRYLQQLLRSFRCSFCFHFITKMSPQPAPSPCQTHSSFSETASVRETQLQFLIKPLLSLYICVFHGKLLNILVFFERDINHQPVFGRCGSVSLPPVFKPVSDLCGSESSGLSQFPFLAGIWIWVL